MIRTPSLVFRFIEVLIAAVCLYFANPSQITAQTRVKLQNYNLGGDFILTDTNGKPFALKELRGRVTLLYFGYTSCTEACPVMFAKVATAYKQLGEASKNVTVVLVTVDPARDTPEILQQYLQYFRLNSVGLTGKKGEIDKVVKQYGARYEIEKSDSAMGYHVNHSTDLYLIDQDGKLRYRFKHDDDAATIAAGVKQLL